MKRARNVSPSAARGAALSILAFAALPLAAHAQELRGALGAAAAPAQPAAPATAPLPKGVSESVAAVVNDDIISTYDLSQRVRLLIATSGVQPNEQTLPQFEREALISLIDERLQLQELKRVEKEQKFSIIATDDEVNEELEGMAKQNNMTGEQFLAAMRSQGIGPETLKQQLRAQVSWQRWIRGRYGSRLRIGEDQIKAALDRMAAAASKPQYEISEVFIDANRVGGMRTAMQGAQQLVAQMQQGAPFAAVARQFSASATAANGGDAGWISQGEMPPEVDSAIEQLRPGQLSQPIQVKDGVYIIYLRDKRSGAGQTLVSLKQAAIALPANASQGDVEAARVKLAALRVQVKGCGDIEKAAASVPGVVAGDLGEAEMNDLAPQFKEVAQTLSVGQVSEPIRTNVGLHLVAVCGKRASGGPAVDHDAIENRLYGQQLSMISRRYMRDLRTSATIETR
ncbi:peptidylprolyl isomerase [Phenylobacterium soli]|uniref:Parvulin-like PPIase n=1 Tax=Phenylobacterium soli TaxID=2170551 RepID=A0A328AS48_9CAUL|nr:peptidylprolyl isomerase [Phenylobacterium soli]RAK56354.1 peptidylprolyl isomerase [Phenylobacterium soli]